MRCSSAVELSAPSWSYIGHYCSPPRVRRQFSRREAKVTKSWRSCKLENAHHSGHTEEIKWHSLRDTFHRNLRSAQFRPGQDLLQIVGVKIRMRAHITYVLWDPGGDGQTPCSSPNCCEEDYHTHYCSCSAFSRSQQRQFP